MLKFAAIKLIVVLGSASQVRHLSTCRSAVVRRLGHWAGV